MVLEIIRPGGVYRLGVEPIGVLELLCEATFTAWETAPSAERLANFRALERDFTEVVEKTRRQFHDPFGKGLLNRRARAARRRHVDQYAAIYAHTGDARILDRLFELAEYAKTSLIRDRLRTENPRLAGVPDSIPTRIAEFQERIEKLYYGVEDGGPAADSLREKLFTVRREYDAFRAQLTKNYPNYHALTELPENLARPRVLAFLERSEARGLQNKPKRGQAPSGSKGDKAVPPPQTLLVYLRGMDRYYALLLTDTLTLIDCGGVTAIDGAVATWRQSLASVLTDDHLADGHALYELIWEPLVPHLPGRDILIVPTGQLARIPFAALSASPGKPDYLLYDHVIHYAYSLALYARQSQPNPSTPSDLLTIAPGFTDDAEDNPLHQPWSLDLARDVATGYAGRTLTGAEATETAVRAALPTAGTLLFATHSRMDAEFPLRSGIHLTAGGPEDGTLTLAEIFGSSLPADLAILGLCESGLGEEAPGDGMLSLAYAFGYAGCRGTYHTLWMVDDRANGELVGRTLTHLAAGEERGAALRLAKLEYLEEAGAGLEHPYYWAGLVGQGAGGSVDLRSNATTPWYWIVGVVTMLIIVSLVYRIWRSGRRGKA